MSKDKKLSPKQKKIAAMAGNPNKIEGKDFQKLKTIKAGTGEGIETARKHKKYIKDKYETAKGYLKEMFDPAPTMEEMKIKELKADALGSAGPYFSKMARSNSDRLTKIDQDKVNEISEKIGSGKKTGGVMKANKGISVNHSMDHPDVVAAAERDKKNTEEFKEKYPIFSKLMPKESDKEIKQRAKRFVDRVQTEGAKIRTATEGSFSKGGSVMARGNKLARSKPTKIY